MDVSTWNSDRRRFMTTTSPALGRKLIIKRSTTQAEATEIKNDAGTPLERTSRIRESIENEALAIAYVKEHTTIPVPNVVAAYEDRGCFYLTEELCEGAISGDEVPVEHHGVIREQLEKFVRQLRDCRSRTIRSFTGRPFFAARFDETSEVLVNAAYLEDPEESYVLCHGDLAWHNLLVDPVTFKVVCVLDWEFAGFYPKEFRDFWPRPGSCDPLDEEKRYAPELDDMDCLTDRLYELARMEAGRVAMSSGQVFGGNLKLGASEGSNSVLGYTDLTGDISQRGSAIPYTTRLRQINIGQPLGQRLTHKSLLVRTPMITRHGVSDALNMISDVWATDYRAMRSMVLGLIDNEDEFDPVRKPMTLYGESLHFCELYTLLPNVHRDLAASIDRSRRPLAVLADHMGKVAELSWKLKDLEGINRTEEEETVRARLRKYKEQTRDVYDKAYRESEVQRWQAIQKYAKRLLTISHAAIHIAPYLPDDHQTFPNRRDDPVRASKEDRVKSVIAGGSGGWRVDILDEKELRPGQAPHAEVDRMYEDPVNSSPPRPSTPQHDDTSLNRRVSLSEFTYQPVQGFKPKRSFWSKVMGKKRQ